MAQKEINLDNYQEETIAILLSKEDIKLNSQTLSNWMNNKTLLLPDFKRGPVDYVTHFTRDQRNRLDHSESMAAVKMHVERRPIDGHVADLVAVNEVASRVVFVVLQNRSRNLEMLWKN